MLYGTPGVGKSMLAKAAAELLPDLSDAQIASGALTQDDDGFAVSQRRAPFRQPHHTSSYAALIGNPKRSGEVSLAHNGILFLDEMAEIDRRALESLRQPLESKRVLINDGSKNIILQADFILIGTMNPCRCGYHGSVTRKCTCLSLSVQRYNDKISGPISDRIDLWVYLTERDARNNPHDKGRSVSGKDMRRQVITVRKSKEELPAALPISEDAANALIQASEKFHFSKRSEASILRISETIARIEESETVEERHMLEALSFRKKEKRG